MFDFFGLCEKDKNGKKIDRGNYVWIGFLFGGWVGMK